MNIEELVWNFDLKFSDRLKLLTDMKLELEKLITNRKKLSFNIYYKFTNNLNNLKTYNQKWKEIVLAIEVIKIVKRWYRKYKIDLKKVYNGNYFINYFKNSIDISKFNLCSIGINFYHREGYTAKTFILWANKLCKLGIIGESRFNSFMEYLETDSLNGKRN